MKGVTKMIQYLNKNLTGGILILFITLALITMQLELQARELKEQEVRKAVETWVRYVTADAKPNAIIELMEAYPTDGEIVAYIAHLFGGGFCICGANDLLLPVYFYCPEGTYKMENPVTQAILTEIKMRQKDLNEIVKSRNVQLAEIQQQLTERVSLWKQLIMGSVPIKPKQVEGLLAEPDSMSVQLTCKWGQGSPYNDLCPELTPNVDEHTLVGCTSTAISQLMYYWKWPNTGVGSYSSTYNYRWRGNWDQEALTTDPNINISWSNRLRWSNTSGGQLQMNGYWDQSVYDAAIRISSNAAYLTALSTLYNRLTQGSTTISVNYGATTYQWNVMQDRHSDPVDAGDAAVATICYHVGVALDMEYGLYASSAGLWEPVEEGRKPLENNFRYDGDAIYAHTDIENLVTKEIQWLRPVGFSGGPPNHTWVVYGYNKGTDPNRQFRMNMGWNGGSDGWYTLDNAPINQNHGYLIYVAPKGVVRFVGNTVTGDGSPLEPYKNIEEAVTNVSNGTTLIFKAGSDNRFTAPLTINKALTLKGRNIIIQKQ